MNKQIKTILEEFDKKQRLFLGGKYHSTQFNAWFKQSLEKIAKQAVDDCIPEEKYGFYNKWVSGYNKCLQDIKDKANKLNK